MRWINSAVGAALTFIAILLTAYPPPAFPLRWLPAVAASILFVMLLWQQRPEVSIPPAHIESMRRLAEELIRDMDAGRILRFSIDPPRSIQGLGPIWSIDPEASALWRDSLRSHSDKTYRDLVEWERRCISFTDANAVVDRKAVEVAAALEKDYGIDLEHAQQGIGRAVSAQLKTPPQVATTPSNFHISDTPSHGMTLFWGGSGILSSRAANAEADLGEARDVLIAAVDTVPTWIELGPARVALAKRETQGQVVRRALVQLANSHSLSGHCDVCRP